MFTKFLLKSFAAQFAVQIRISIRRRAEIINPVVFFVLVVSMFPLGLSADPALLTAAAPAIIWVTILLAVMMALDMSIRSDFDNGSLEQMALTPAPLPWLLLARTLALWSAIGLPMIVVAPIAGIALGLSADAIVVMVITLLLGSPVLFLIGSIGVGLTAGLQQAGVLLTLIVMPLYVPILIFGALAIDDAMDGLPVSGALWMLAALLVLALTLAPFAAAGAVRTSLE